MVVAYCCVYPLAHEQSDKITYTVITSGWLLLSDCHNYYPFL